jgi:hypothetical protein
VETIIEFASRIMPAVIMLAAATQFTIGYMLFLAWIDRNHLAPRQMEPFHYWKMPFGVAAVVVSLAVARMLDYRSVSVIADNWLTILVVFYTVTGLSLLEFALRKMHLTVPRRAVFYVAMVLLPFFELWLVGTIWVSSAISLLVVLAGFVDSFVDWRKVRLREYM